MMWSRGYLLKCSSSFLVQLLFMSPSILLPLLVRCDFIYFLLLCIFSFIVKFLTLNRSAGRERHLQERSGRCADQHKQPSSTTQEPHFRWLRSRLALWAQTSSSSSSSFVYPSFLAHGRFLISRY